MDEKLKKRWVSALRGTIRRPDGKRYKQGTGRLCLYHHGEKYHCCLGVLKELETGRTLSTVTGRAAGLGNEDLLSYYAQDALSEMNDGDADNYPGDSFRVIADWIENNI